MKTLYAVTPTGEVLGVAVRMKDMRWRFTRTDMNPGPKSYPTADAAMSMVVRSMGATYVEARDEQEASFKAKQITIGF